MRPADAAALYAPPDQLRALGYSLDDPAEMSAIRAVAEAAVLGARRHIDRAVRLSDLVQSWRKPGAPFLQGYREQGIHTIIEKLRTSGVRGLCGHDVVAVAALWRSLGGAFREVRFMDENGRGWQAGHYGLELWLADEERWAYFDTEYNGYPVDLDGRALSLLQFDVELGRGPAVAMVGSTHFRNWTEDELLGALRDHPVQVYAMRNHLCDFDPARRFGRWNFARPVFERLPSPFDRATDALTGDAAVRYRLRPAPASPALASTLIPYAGMAR